MTHIGGPTPCPGDLFLGTSYNLAYHLSHGKPRSGTPLLVPLPKLGIVAWQMLLMKLFGYVISWPRLIFLLLQLSCIVIIKMAYNLQPILFSMSALNIEQLAREKLISGAITACYTPTIEQLAKIFTKALGQR